MPDPLTPDERAAIRARTDAATSGPWTAGPAHTWGEDTLQCAVLDGDEEPITWDDHSGEVFTPANAEFIAHARTDVPRLLDALEVAEAEVERLRAALAVDRETIAQRAFEAAGRDDWGVANDLERDEWLAVADAVLYLLPGRSEAEVKAEALREFRRGFGRDFALQDPYGHFDTETMSACHRQVEELLDARADRIEGGADRG